MCLFKPKCKHLLSTRRNFFIAYHLNYPLHGPSSPTCALPLKIRRRDGFQVQRDFTLPVEKRDASGASEKSISVDSMKLHISMWFAFVSEVKQDIFESVDAALLGKTAIISNIVLI